MLYLVEANNTISEATFLISEATKALLHPSGASERKMFRVSGGKKILVRKARRKGDNMELVDAS